MNLRLTPSRILLTKCGIASRRLAARSSVIHPSTAARLRRPDRTSGAASRGGMRDGGESLLSTARTPYTDEPSTAASETERERVSKRHTPAVRTLPSRPQPRPSCHYLPSCSTASRNLAHSPARYSALSPFPSLVSSIGSPTYSLSLFPNSL